MSKKLLAVSVFAAALAACGTPKKSADDPSKTPGGGTQSHALTHAELAQQCGEKFPNANSFVSNDGGTCYAEKHVVQLVNGYTGPSPLPFWSGADERDLVISQLDPNGASQSVFVTVNGANRSTPGTPYSQLNIPAPDHGANDLALLIRGRASCASTTFLYECYDANMSRVNCRGRAFP